MTDYENHPVFMTESSSRDVVVADKISQAVAVLQKLVTVINAGEELAAKSQDLSIETTIMRVAKRFVAERSARNRYFDADLCAEPAWDMLLDLYIQGEMSQDVSVSSSCIASRMPPTTALRCQKSLVARGVIIRSSDPSDGRRILLSLAPAIHEKMSAYLTSFSPKPTPFRQEL